MVRKKFKKGKMTEQEQRERQIILRQNIQLAKDEIKKRIAFLKIHIDNEEIITDIKAFLA